MNRVFAKIDFKINRLEYKKAALAFLKAYVILTLCLGGLISIVISYLNPGEVSIWDEIIGIATIALISVPLSGFVAWPAFLLGLLTTIALHQRRIVQMEYWLATGILVGLLTGFGLGRTGIMDAYGLAGMACSFLTWRFLNGRNNNS